MASNKKSRGTRIKCNKDSQYTSYDIPCCTNYADSDSDTGNTFAQSKSSRTGLKLSDLRIQGDVSSQLTKPFVAYPSDTSDRVRGHVLETKGLVSHYTSNGYDVYQTNMSSPESSDVPTEDESIIGGHAQYMAMSNDALKWLKEPRIDDDEEEEDVLSKLVQAKQRACSLKWASPVEDGPSEGSIQASSQLLEEHVVLLNLEDDDGASDISVVTPDVWPHLAQSSTNLLRLNPNNVDRQESIGECYDKSIMPYSPSAAIERLSPIFDEPTCRGSQIYDSSPEQVVPVGSSIMSRCDKQSMYGAKKLPSRCSSQDMHVVTDSNPNDCNKEPCSTSQSVPDLSVCSRDEQFLRENRIKSSDESYYELCFLTSDAESDNQMSNGADESAVENDLSCAEDSQTSGCAEAPVKPPRHVTRCDAGADNALTCQSLLPSENSHLKPDQSDCVGSSLSLHSSNSDHDDQSTSVSLLEQLPEELIFNILFYLSIQELCTSVAPLSHKWKHYAYDPILWQIIDLSHHRYRNMGSVHLCRLLRRAKLLKSLNIRGRYTLNLTEVKILGYHCTMLQELNLGFCENLKEGIIQTIMEHCKALTTVNVEGSDSVDNQIAYYFTYLPELRVLNLSHCTKITDESIINIAVLCEKLEALNIDGIPWITDTAIRCIASERQATLEAVFLDGAELTDDSIQNLTTCHKLHTLSISFCEEFTDKSLGFLRKLTSPKHLRLKRGIQFTEPALAELCLTENMASLTYLNLTECSELSDRGVENITRMCKKLQHLALCWCWDVSDVGLECIVDNCRYLEVLDLLGLNKIKGQCLNRIPEALPFLKFLDLRQCNMIQDSLLVTLVTVKRDLSILNYYGEEVLVGSLTIDEIVSQFEQARGEERSDNIACHFEY